MRKDWLQADIGSELKHAFKVRTLQQRQNMTIVLQNLIWLYNAGELDELLEEQERSEEAVPA